MDKLKQELAKKKEENKKTLALLGIEGNKNKFIKLGDLEALKNRNSKLSNNVETHAQHDKNFVVRSYNNDGCQGLEHTREEETRRANLTRKEVIRRLREREEPISLFGESDYEAFMRLKALEMLAPEINKGFKNDFQDAMDEVNENYMNELLKSSTGEEGESMDDDVKVNHDGTTYEELLEMSEEFGKGDAKLDSQVMLKYLKLVLRLWGEELNKRPETIKRSLKGKTASANHVQTVKYIDPLIKKLKKLSLSDDIFSCLVDIVRSLIGRDYLKANEAYLEMAIGNAPWPIGVTMVGIHARTGREKISARNVAHVLNDETQRKYIQALKRLMTKAQVYFPTVPSRSVNYAPPSTSDN